MIIRKGYKYNLRTTPRQRSALRAFIDGCNIVYNWGLDRQIEVYKAYKEYVATYGEEEAKKNKIARKITGYDLCKELTPWRKQATGENYVVQLTPAFALQQTLLDLDRAYTNYFRKNARFPTRKTNKKYGAFRLYNANLTDKKTFTIQNDPTHTQMFVNIAKIGKIPFYLSRPIEGDIKYITVSQEGDRWFVSFQIQYEDENIITEADQLFIHYQTLLEKGKTVAISMGIEPFLSLSDGKTFHAPHPYENNLKIISSLHKKLKKKNGKTHYFRALLALEKKYILIKNIRNDWLHKLTTELANNYDTIYLPDIKVTEWDKPKKLSKKAKEHIEDANYDLIEESAELRDIRRKIRDQGWHQFKILLTYKMEERNKRLALIEMPKGEDTTFSWLESSVEKAKKILESQQILRVN